MLGPQGGQLYTASRETQGHFNILAPQTGEYKVCFSNRLSTSAEKVVSFRLHHGEPGQHTARRLQGTSRPPAPLVCHALQATKCSRAWR